MSQIAFTYYGKPEPQGSLKGFILEGQLDQRTPVMTASRGMLKPNWMRRPRVVLTSDNDALKPYRDMLAVHAHNAMVQARLDRPMAAKGVAVELLIDFTFVLPPSVKKRAQVTVKPDVDKLCRAVLDSLKGIVFEDDSQVVEIVAGKRYGTLQSVHVSARTIEERTLFTDVASSSTESGLSPRQLSPRKSARR